MSTPPLEYEQWLYQWRGESPRPIWYLTTEMQVHRTHAHPSPMLTLSARREFFDELRAGIPLAVWAWALVRQHNFEHYMFLVALRAEQSR